MTEEGITYPESYPVWEQQQLMQDRHPQLVDGSVTFSTPVVFWFPFTPSTLTGIENAKMTKQVNTFAQGHYDLSSGFTELKTSCSQSILLLIACIMNVLLQALQMGERGCKGWEMDQEMDGRGPV